MLKKKMFLLMASILAISYCTNAQARIDGQDTAKTGCLYVSNEQTFKLESGYLQRVISFTWDYQPSQTAKPGADSVTMVKVKKYSTPVYYLIKDSANKKIWVQVSALQDYNLDFTLKRK